MTHEQYLGYPQELTVRELDSGGRVLVTSMLQPRKVPKRELGKLYERRWNIELDFRNIKTTLGLDMLSCKSPPMCEKELWVYLRGLQPDPTADGAGGTARRHASATVELQAYRAALERMGCPAPGGSRRGTP